MLEHAASPGQLAPNFNMIHATDLEWQQVNAAAAAGQQGNNIQAHLNPGNDFILAVVSFTINLRGFWLDNPHSWFNMYESAFAVCHITSPVTKYYHCVGILPAETVASVEDVVNHFA